MKKLQSEIYLWAVERFGIGDVSAIAIRGNKEMAELLSSCEHRRPAKELAEECADVCFFLLQICELIGYDLEEEVQKKFAVNQKRSWKKASDGSYQHVEEEVKNA